MGVKRRRCSIDLEVLIESTFLSDYECDSTIRQKSKRLKVLEDVTISCDDNWLNADTCLNNDACAEANDELQNAENVHLSPKETDKLLAG